MNATEGRNGCEVTDLAIGAAAADFWKCGSAVPEVPCPKCRARSAVPEFRSCEVWLHQKRRNRSRARGRPSLSGLRRTSFHRLGFRNRLFTTFMSEACREIGAAWTLKSREDRVNLSLARVLLARVAMRISFCALVVLPVALGCQTSILKNAGSGGTLGGTTVGADASSGGLGGTTVGADASSGGLGGTTSRTDSSGGGAGGTTTRIDSSTGGAVGGTKGTKPTGGTTGTTTGTTPMCYADFPCSSPYSCTSDKHGYQPYATVDCHSTCGPGPCSGASCIAQGSPVPCPYGTLCIDGLGDFSSSACQPVDSGIIDSGSILSDGGSAICLDMGKDCTSPQSACCAGSECVTLDDGKTFTCHAVSCTTLGNNCQANIDCCAGLDCMGGKCVAKTQACLEKPADGVCGGTSGGTCCPGTTCGPVTGSSSNGCAIPSQTKPQDWTCIRDRPNENDPCSWTKFGLSCTYSDWAKEPGIFYTCTCSYHGWTCVQGHYV
jgi:hypothetical protein